MRIPKLISKTLSKEKLFLQFDTGENRYLTIDILLRILNETGFSSFIRKDIVESQIEDGIIIFPTKIATLKTPSGVIEKPYDIDPEFIYLESKSNEPSIGEIFKKLRIEKGLSIENVAKVCSTDKAYISKFERNKVQAEWNSIRRLFFLGLKTKLEPSNLIQNLASMSLYEATPPEVMIPRYHYPSDALVVIGTTKSFRNFENAGFAVAEGSTKYGHMKSVLKTQMKKLIAYETKSD